MVLEMDNSRRAFDRSRDPGPMKKPRVAEEPIRPLNPNTRQFPPHRPLGSVAVATPTSRFRAGGRETESNSSDPSREAYQPQPVNPHHELVSQYKSALSELTFNSKPIITNLTIIAGENLHAAKAIVATISNNILEVPSDQKLPSLYLLDSIVKNIGRDYIKYFAAKLPEIFIKAYKQVDAPTHSSMRHLFGTWKGVFHPQTLQIIEKDLGFTSRSDGSSSAVPTTRADPQAQRPPPSIHVNPKYLERQRLQQSSRAKGMVTDMPGNIPNSTRDSDRLDRASSLTAGGAWLEPSVRINSMRRAHREPLGEPPYEKELGSMPVEYDDASDLPQNSRSGIKKVNLRITDEGREKQRYGARCSVPEMISFQRDGLNSKSRIPVYSTARSANSDLSGTARSSVSVSNSWKNSEEEEFMWDMHSRLSETDVANINPRNELWTPDESERLEPENHIFRPPRIQDASSRFDSENSADLYSSDQRDRNAFGHWISSPRSLQDNPIQHKSEDQSSVVGGLPPVRGARKGSQPQVSRAGVAGSEILQNFGSGSDRQSPIHDLTSLQNSAKQDFRRTNSLPQRDPRASRFPVKLPSVSRDDPTLSLSSSGQSRNTQILELPDTSQAKSLNSLPMTENAPGRPDPAVSEASGQPKIGNLLAAVMKTGILSNKTSGVTKEETFQDDEKPSSQPRVQPSVSADLPQTQTSRHVPASLPNTSVSENLSTHMKVEELAARTSLPTSKENSNAPDPISNLLSSLVSKGLISASKAEMPPLLQCQVPSTTRDHSPENSTNSSMSAASAVVSDCQPVSLVDRAAQSAAPKIEGSTAPSETTKADPEDLMGLQFRSDKIRKFHPSVINSLFDDLPHQCTSCGVRLKRGEQLDKHMELHENKRLEPNKANREKCAWFPNADDWVSGNPRQHEPEPERAVENCLLVPADENQCACILCGEMFKDHFSQEADQWMFKGAVYMNISSANTDAKGPIVHATCLNDDSAQDLGLKSRVKQENDV